MIFFFFFFKQKTAYEIYQCDWSSDVCSSDLTRHPNPYLDCECDLTQPLPFRDGEFDTLVLSDV